jgi:hypothetical protein
MNRNQDTSRYYMPYDSGEDTDVDTDEDDEFSDEDNTVFGEDYRIRRQEDPRYAIIATAGPNLNTSAQQLKYMEHAPGAIYDSSTNITSLANYKYLEPPKTTLTTLICLRSGNRDRNVYPSPFDFTIKLPRVYKTVTKFQLVQLSFPFNTDELVSQTTIVSSFLNFVNQFGFQPSCLSACLAVFAIGGTSETSMSLLEENRINDNGKQFFTTITIPDGKYSNPGLANELTFQANNTPPFNLISYEDFQRAFKITRDISILFNEPGDNFYSKVNLQRFKHHSKENIMNTYYTRKEIDKFPIINDIIAFNAYYYPVLKELFATEIGDYFISTDFTGISKSQIKNYVLNTFLGLDDILYYQICSTNKGLLDEFRKNYTFEHRNINKYIWTYEEAKQKYCCQHETLHTSIKNDINNSFNKFYNEELQLYNLNHITFNNLKIYNSNNNTILDHLEFNLSSIFSNFFLNESQFQYKGGQFYSTISDNIYVSRTADELNDDNNFTSIFNFTSTIGRQYGTYAGKLFTFTNFLDYHSTISSFYTNVQSTTNFISTVNGCTYCRHHDYVSNKYKYVLPPNIIENKSYNTNQSVPVAFVNKLVHIPGQQYNTIDNSCLSSCISVVISALNRYYSCLPVSHVINTLNYRLGLHTLDVVSFKNLLSFFETVSTQKFDFFLQVNPEQSFNNMDIVMNENYNISNEGTGQSKLMYAKILTAGLGANETSQTCIQNPIIFNNPLGRLDRLSFKIYLDDATLTPMWSFYPFPQQISEWTATFQIDEEIGLVDKAGGWGPTPTIPIPTNPSAMQFLALTSTST